MCVLSLSHVQLCDPMGCSPQASSVHGIVRARILDQVAISYLTQESYLCLFHLLHWQADSLPLCHLGSP